MGSAPVEPQTRLRDALRSPRSVERAGESVKGGRAPTKQALIDVAEALFGTHGFDGISLREIAAAAGQRNYNAVQYHFGSKRGLINAILDTRYRQLDRIRADIIRARYGANDLSALNVRDLLKLLWEPAFVVCSLEASAACCQFQLQYRLNPYVADHPLYDSDGNSVPVEKPMAGDECPTFYLVARLLRSRFKNVDETGFHKRAAAISYMFLCAMVEQDNHLKTSDKGLEIDFEIILDMMAAAMFAQA